VITQYATIGLQEAISCIGELRGSECDGWGAAVPDFVNDFAGKGCGWVFAEEGITASSRGFSAKGELDPSVGHAVGGGENGGDVTDAGVAGIRVAKDENWVTNRKGANMRANLLKVGGTGCEVAGFGSTGCQEVKI